MAETGTSASSYGDAIKKMAQFNSTGITSASGSSGGKTPPGSDNLTG
jgi:hypothetical protein